MSNGKVGANKKFYLTFFIPLVAVVVILFIVFVPVISETQVVYANWATITNGTENALTSSNGQICPAYSTCTSAPTGLSIPSIVSVSYYLWKFGGENLEGNISVYANGFLSQAMPITGASTYVVVFGQTCVTGYICLANSTMSITPISNSSSTSTSSSTTA